LNHVRWLWLLLLLLQVLARHVNPEQMLEVVHLNEVLAEAQRGAAAADAAVAAVDKVGAAEGVLQNPWRVGLDFRQGFGGWFACRNAVCSIACSQQSG
jgi:hypothetical protein